MTRLQFVGAAGVAALAVSLGACNPAAPAKPAVDTAKVADAVKADATQALADYNAHDAAKFARHLAADGVGMFHGAPNVVGSAAMEATLKQAPPDPAAHVTLSAETVDVAASGDMAVFRSKYVGVFTDPKTRKTVTEPGNYLVGYKQQADGTWKQEWSVVSDEAPAPAAAPAAKS